MVNFLHRGQDACQGQLHHLGLALASIAAEALDQLVTVLLAPLGKVAFGVFAVGVLVDAFGVADFARFDRAEVFRIHRCQLVSGIRGARKEIPPQPLYHKWWYPVKRLVPYMVVGVEWLR